MHCIVFCIHLVVLQSYLSLFSHITCIHFAKLGTQLDLKINWLIFESLLHFSICYFMCELQKIFFLRDMMDNQCANIFSNHAIVYGSHSVKFAYIKRDNIFLQVNPHFFEFGLCLFIYPHLLNFPQNCFSQNLFCFSYFYRGRNLFFKT